MHLQHFLVKAKYILPVLQYVVRQTKNASMAWNASDVQADLAEKSLNYGCHFSSHQHYLEGKIKVLAILVFWLHLLSLKVRIKLPLAFTNFAAVSCLF